MSGSAASLSSSFVRGAGIPVCLPKPRKLVLLTVCQPAPASVPVLPFAHLTVRPTCCRPQIPGVPIMYIQSHRYTIERLPEATMGGAPRS